MRPISERLWAKVTILGPDDCWEWQGWRHPVGHGQIGAGRRGEGLRYTHVAAWAVFNGRNVPEGLIVRHTCDNPPCCNPNHLILGTMKDNTHDMLRRRRHSYGERHATKLTDDKVREIKTRLAAGETQREIALDFGIARSLVGLIGQGKRWSHI